MPEQTLHQRLIEELLSGRVSLTPREEAAKQEILKLRGQHSPKLSTPPDQEGKKSGK